MMTRILTTVAVLGALVGATACTDITTAPQSTVSNENIFNDPSSYTAFLAKLYAGLAVTGQQGAPASGSADIEGIDQGFSQYLRQLWQLQELPTDEAMIQWNDQTLPELQTQLWSSQNRFVAAMYYRVFFQVTMVNKFLQETTPELLDERGASDALQATVRQYRAEARFLRALSYWHGLDLFGDIPLVTEEDVLGTDPPQQSTRGEIYEYVVQELQEIQAELPPMGQAGYARADQGAALMLLAKLYLNSEAYGMGDRYAEALQAVEQLITSGAYQLAGDYLLNFQADNHTSPEIIFPIAFDGERIRTWGGTTFLIHAALGGSMDATDYGITEPWWGLRVTPQFVSLYPGAVTDPDASPDNRASILYADGQTLEVETLSGNFTHGYAAPKYRNLTSSGAPGSNVTFPDTDYPMFRLADAYLMYAEAHLRGGGGTAAQAVIYINELRERAYGDDGGNITEAELTLQFVLDERARELFWEGHRRTDLIRYGLFTSGDKLWSWKGGVQEGTATEACRALYPLPADELSANRNLEQNECYAS